MRETLFAAATIAIVALVTWLVRLLPYLLFGGKREVPRPVVALGDTLPAAIMVLLVLYCLRGIRFSVFPHGLPELFSVIAVALTQLAFKKTILSVFVGTALYMILIRTLFVL